MTPDSSPNSSLKLDAGMDITAEANSDNDKTPEGTLITPEFAAERAALNLESSPLLRLPRELRAKIQVEVLMEQDPIYVALSDSMDEDYLLPLALLHTCQLLRKEAVEIYYAANTFGAAMYYGLIKEWLATLPCHHVTLLKNVEVEFSHWPKPHEIEKFEDRLGLQRGVLSAACTYTSRDGRRGHLWREPRRSTDEVVEEDSDSEAEEPDPLESYIWALDPAGLEEPYPTN
jgi:hypothetical protein